MTVSEAVKIVQGQGAFSNDRIDRIDRIAPHHFVSALEIHRTTALKVMWPIPHCFAPSQI